MSTPDSDREVPMADDADLVVLPDQTSDDLDTDWRDLEGEDAEARLLADRPPHWDA